MTPLLPYLHALLNVVQKICVLDEPSNFLDREALGGLAVAIKEWSGAVVRIYLTTITVLAHSEPLLAGHHFAQ